MKKKEQSMPETKAEELTLVQRKQLFQRELDALLIKYRLKLDIKMVERPQLIVTE